MIAPRIKFGRLNFGNDHKANIELLSKSIQLELDHIRRYISPATPATTATTVFSTGSTSSSGSSGGSSSGKSPKAGISAITTVSDQFIAFTGDPLSNYVLFAYFLDSSGQFANLPVVQADYASTGFTLRGALIPSAGMVFYTAVPKN